MKTIFICLTFLIQLIISLNALAELPDNTYELGVDGMTCPFCVYSIEKNLNKLSGVKKAQVSLEQKKVRIEMQSGKTFNEKEVRKVITDSGFTPSQLDSAKNHP